MHKAPRIYLSVSAALFYPMLLFIGNEQLLAALLPAVIFHEAGHLLAIRFLGAQLREIRIEATGLSIHATPIAHPGQEAFCALAGPLGGICWAAAAAALGGRFFAASAALSLLLSAFNLLPALPLDGGRAILALSGRERLLRFLGACCSLLLLASALYWRIYLLLLPALWLWLRSIIRP